MNVNFTEVTKYYATNLDKLDPVGYTLEDFGSNQGKITIDCYGESWTAYFGSMGCNSISEFILSCDEYYLANKLSSVDSTEIDYDAIGEKIGQSVDRETLVLYSDEMACTYGTDWIMDLPTQENPEYTYLLRIIRAVQEAIKPT